MIPTGKIRGTSSLSQVEFIGFRRSYKLELDYDWTYQTDYSGDLSGLRLDPTSETIDFAKLRTGTIQYMDENVLFEDEMGDNGTSSYIVKTVS